jgi:4-carboxymuconolactone decarboxylase
VIAAVYQFGLLEIHVASARKLGATDAELAEAVLCAFPAAGMTVWAGGAAAIAAGR